MPGEPIVLSSVPTKAPAFAGPLVALTVPPRRKLVQEGRPCGDLFMVHAGWLMAFRQLPDGGRQIFNFWLPGEIAGVELLAFAAAPYSVATITSCRISRLARGSIEAEDIFPGGLATLTMLACRNGLIMRERIVSLGRRSAFCRVAHLLLELGLRAGLTRGETTVPLPLTQLEIADSTGLTAPYVNRIFKTLRERGFLKVSKAGCELQEAEKLMKLVEFRPNYLLTDRDALMPAPELLGAR